MSKTGFRIMCRMTALHQYLGALQFSAKQFETAEKPWNFGHYEACPEQSEGTRRSNLYHIDFNKARLLHGVYPEMTNEGFAMTTFSTVSIYFAGN